MLLKMKSYGYKTLYRRASHRTSYQTPERIDKIYERKRKMATEQGLPPLRRYATTPGIYRFRLKAGLQKRSTKFTLYKFL